jgi:SAM-dependent methyltransferase
MENMDKENYISKIVKESGYFVRSGEALRAIKKYVRPGGCILEIGPGSGGVLMLLKQNGYKVEAVDNKNRIDPKISGGVEIKALDVCFSPLPFSSNFFDAVVMFCVMEHLENPYFTIREVTRVLKNKGIFIFGMPYIHNLKSKISFLLKGDICDYTKKNDHRTLFTKSVFVKTFKDFVIMEKTCGGGFLRVFGRKIKFNSKLLHNLLGQRVLYVLRKK